MISNNQKHRPNGAAAEGGACVSDYLISYMFMGAQRIYTYTARTPEKKKNTRRCIWISLGLGLLGGIIEHFAATWPDLGLTLPNGG